MDTTRNPLHALVTALTRNTLSQVVLIVLLTAVVGGSGILLLGALDESSNAQRDVEALNVSVTDLDKLNQVSNISGQGWMADSTDLGHLVQILGTLTKGNCCALDSDFAINSLTWLDHAAVVLASEKELVTAIELTGEAGKGLQRDIVTAYESHENSVRAVATILADWNGSFGDVRLQRIKDAGDTTQISASAYTGAQAKLDQGITAALQKLGETSSRRQALQGAIKNAQLRTYVWIAGIVLGLILFAGFMVLIVRSRSQTARLVPQTARVRQSAKPKRSRAKQR